MFSFRDSNTYMLDLRLQPSVKPVECIVLHLRIKFVNAGIETTLVSISPVGFCKYFSQDTIGSLHFWQRVQRIVVVVERHGRQRRPQSQDFWKIEILWQ